MSLQVLKPDPAQPSCKCQVNSCNVSSIVQPGCTHHHPQFSHKPAGATVPKEPARKSPTAAARRSSSFVFRWVLRPSMTWPTPCSYTHRQVLQPHPVTYASSSSFHVCVSHQPRSPTWVGSLTHTCPTVTPAKTTSPLPLAYLQAR